MLVPGHRIAEEVCRSRDSVLWRGQAELDGAAVLVRTPRVEEADPAVLLRLKREYALLRDLGLPGVAHVRGFLPSAAPPALVLDDPGGACLKTRVLAGALPLTTVLRVAVQLAEILSALHRRDLVHRDLNPFHLLFDERAERVTLVSLGHATRLPSEQQAPRSPDRLAGTLHYCSPEQTGRMNRDVDYRTDLYSLGVTLYELLCRRLPFDSADPLELVHAHIARLPAPPTELDAAIPATVSAIVLKLLAKTPEARYQSAAGAAADLHRCLAALERALPVPVFTPGEQDRAERFVVSQRLYGRDREVEELLDAFDRACAGAFEAVMVSGYSGIGKTSIVNELNRALIGKRGYVVAGKFDQLARNVPYAAITQAFGSLVRQLLTESEEAVGRWRSELRDAMGAGGQVIIDVIPALELLAGRQAPGPALGPAEAQNRFNLLFRKLIGVFATPAHPLVLFLDDLQWADAATLALLRIVLAAPESGGMLLIGAYRDNEVGPAHPLIRTLSELRAEGVEIRELAVRPLGLEHLNQMVADSLRSEPAECRPLAELVLRKTAGNPFFVAQFLTSLHQEGLLGFDPAAGRWTVELAAIEAVGITDNVVDLMARRIRKLPPDVQQVLKLAACVGNRFDVDTLGVVNRLPTADTLRLLWDALQQGLVLPTDGNADSLPEVVELPAGADAPSYRFLHDRVQQAAYALIPEAERKRVHLQVGRRLRDHLEEHERELRIFEVVDQLDIGSDLISDAAERLELAALNRAAGVKAKASAAFRPALSYFEAGCGLLPVDGWDAQYPLAFALHLECAECLYLCGRFEEAERACSELLERARTAAERAEVYLRMVVQYENLGLYEQAVRTAELGLQGFGIVLPRAEDEKWRAFDAELARIRERLGGRRIPDLIELPPMRDPRGRLCMRLLMSAWAPAYIAADAGLVALLPAMVVALSLEHGNTEESACGYVVHGITVGSRLGDFRTGFDWGQLGLAVNAGFDDLGYRAKVHHLFSCFVNPWCEPLRSCFPYAREAYRAGLESGDFPYASYGIFHLSWYGLLTSRELDRFQAEFGANLEFLRGIRNLAFAELQQIILNWAAALQGLTREPTDLTDDEFDEESFDARYRDIPFFQLFLRVVKLHLLYTFGHWAEARETARRAEAVVHSLSGTIWPAILTFYHALTLTALYAGATTEERQRSRVELEQMRGRLVRWAESCPENFAAQAWLVEAEIARIEGRTGAAIEAYERALAATEATDLVLDRALARELYARFWLDRGQERIAATYLAEAHQIYEAWGAAAKARQLVARHTALFEPAAPGAAPPGDGPRPSIPSLVPEPTALDATTLMRTAQVIAEEIDLDRLLAKLMRILLESAGAQRGCLLLEQDGELRVHAEGGDAADVRVLRPGRPLAESELAIAVVNYVRRSGESVVVADAVSDATFGGDPYVRQRQPRSVLCTAVLHRGRLRGVVYLENNLVPEAFAPERAEVMQLLSSQAAIAITNAELFQEVSQLRDRLQAENVYLQEEIKTRHGFEEIIGRSAPLRRVLHQVEQVAPTDATVLLMGETGTGKELVARAIHNLSRRSERTLVTVNCGAISAGLVESELFGHEKGAFTGALQRKIGRFELADGGTIFLDEIGDLPLDLQVKLLRVLQEGEIERVGGTRTLRVDVRVIAATHRDLEVEVAAGAFRSDLYYRLAVFPLQLPPLRERADDIPLLVRYFAAQFGPKLGKRIEAIPRHVLDRLSAYAWPGNIRELRNVVERSVIVSTGPTLQLGEFIPVAPPGSVAVAAVATLEELERGHILSVLERTGWRVSGEKGAARILGLKPTTLEARMRKLNIERPH